MALHIKNMSRGTPDIRIECPQKACSRNTFKKRLDFLRISREGRKAIMPTLIVQAARDKKKEESARFGFTASRKVGSAVVRNRARRRLRAVVDVVMQEKPFLGEYVLIAKRETPLAPFNVLVNDFKKALKYVS